MLSTQTREFRKMILDVLNKASSERELSDQEVIVLFHFVKHQNEPMYSFVPKRYKRLWTVINKI